MSGRHTTSNTGITPTTGDGKTISPNPSSSSSFLEALPDFTSPKPGPLELACPVSSCSLVFKGEMPHGYLWRHLKRPGIYRRTGDEKAAWLNIHKVEYDRLLDKLATPAQRRHEANNVKAQMLRTAEFELRARNMGITEEELVAQKVAIWEGRCAAE